MPPIPPPPPPPQVAQSGAGNNSSTRSSAVRRETCFSFRLPQSKDEFDTIALALAPGAAVFCLGWMRVRGEGAVWLRIVQQDGTGIRRRPIDTRKYSTRPALALTLEPAIT